MPLLTSKSSIRRKTRSILTRSDMSSKGAEAEEDRVPSYEESIASSAHYTQSHSTVTKSSTTPFQQRIREQRQRRIATLLLNHIEPAITSNLDNATNDMSLILLASDNFPSTTAITTSSVTSPPLTKPTTILRLQTDDFKSSFLASWPVVQDISDTLVRSMVDPSSIPQLQAQLPELASATSEGLPERPQPKSWFKRTFGMPGADHDPTGETGKWNLGWRSDENPAMTARTVTANDLVVTAKLVDVSFRTESELGLLESTTAKCLWLDVLFRS